MITAIALAMLTIGGDPPVPFMIDVTLSPSDIYVTNYGQQFQVLIDVNCVTCPQPVCSCEINMSWLDLPITWDGSKLELVDVQMSNTIASTATCNLGVWTNHFGFGDDAKDRDCAAYNEEGDPPPPLIDGAAVWHSHDADADIGFKTHREPCTFAFATFRVRPASCCQTGGCFPCPSTCEQQRCAWTTPITIVQNLGGDCDAAVRWDWGQTHWDITGAVSDTVWVHMVQQTAAGCVGDLNGDGWVDDIDLYLLFTPLPGGAVNPEFTFSLLTMLANWGPCHN